MSETIETMTPTEAATRARAASDAAALSAALEALEGISADDRAAIFAAASLQHMRELVICWQAALTLAPAEIARLEMIANPPTPPTLPGILQ